MAQTMELKGKKVLVYGTGKSGIGAADLLAAVGAKPVLFDEKLTLNAADILAKCAYPDKTDCVIAKYSDEVMDGVEMVVLSPGVPTDLPQVLRMKEAGIPVIGEVELAYVAGHGTVYAITGTNDKTTTTALLGKIMKEWHENTFVVGNIGTAYTSVVTRTNDDTAIVAEISSFQLETIDRFHPHVSAILNITEDHLNRHHTMAEYNRVKESITKNQDMSDYVVLNYEDEELRRFGEEVKAKTNVIYFSSQRRIPGGIWLDGERIVCEALGAGDIMSVKEMKIIGTHNHENAMAAIAMAVAAGVPVSSIVASVKTFTAVPHRIEFIREVNGVVYYNDSKGTNPDAAIKGIEAMDRPTLLIGGGYDKGSDYRPWIRAFGNRVKYLVLEAKTRFDIKAQALECGFPEEKIVLFETMFEALDFCVAHAAPGDAVLLSPACASWGEFDNYEQRGDRFRSYVEAL